MRLAIFSHKTCWRTEDGHVATKGGFPFQVGAIAELFSSSVLLVPAGGPPSPEGLSSIQAKGLEVILLSPLAGDGWRRRLRWLFFWLKHGRQIWREIARADAVHTPLPSDVGLVAMLLAKLQRKRLLVRHCGTWGARTSLADRFLAFLLPRLAGGSTVVFATGGGPKPPTPSSEVEWIFATTLSVKEIETLPVARPWQEGEDPVLISVGRLDRGKNVQAAIRALTSVREDYPKATLHILGDGPEREHLEALTTCLDLQKAVHFHGNLEHKAVLQHLSRSHLLVFPTQVAEGFPKAVLEALAVGVPVIAPRVSVIPELLQGCGLLLPNVRPQTVAETILYALSDSEALASKTKEARRRARRYTLESWQETIAAAITHHWRIKRETLRRRHG